MTLLAFVLKTHTGLRLAELGEVIGLLGGLAFLLGGMTPFMKRAGQTLGGLGLTIGFVLLIVATHWGHFH
jgi:hypothetical protein